MIHLDNLSRVGFGCHLVSDRSQEHYEAVLHALRSDCNLFDTSANYMNGESEKLIGKVLTENSKYDAFIITKSGYNESEKLKIVEGGVGKDNLIHPDFLKNRIELSLSRLQRKHIDGYLLHNPESDLQQLPGQSSHEGFYERIRKAFEFLEEKVSDGKIRYYGISSNTFHLPLNEGVTIDLRKLIAIADEVSSNNHFKLIEFPFNLLETSAVVNHHDGASLLELAKTNRIITFTNRPLNAKTSEGALRLAIYEDDEDLPDDESAGQLFDECLQLIANRLRKGGFSDDVMDFPVVKFLHEYWMQIGNPEAANQIFQDHLYPFLDQLYEGDIPEKELETYLKLYNIALRYSKRTRTQRTIAFWNTLIDKGLLNKGDTRSFPRIACEIYLGYGIDHVLVGMRRKTYVDDLKTLFSPLAL